MKENDEDADNISFNIESNVVYNMKESFISEKKKYPLVSKPTNFGGSVESRENVVSLADILTINMKKTGNYPCNKCQGSSQRNTIRHILNVHEVVKYNFERHGYETGYLKNLKENSRRIRI